MPRLDGRDPARPDRRGDQASSTPISSRFRKSTGVSAAAAACSIRRRSGMKRACDCSCSRICRTATAGTATRCWFAASRRPTGGSRLQAARLRTARGDRRGTGSWRGEVPRHRRASRACCVSPGWIRSSAMLTALHETAADADDPARRLQRVAPAPAFGAAPARADVRRAPRPPQLSLAPADFRARSNPRLAERPGQPTLRFTTGRSRGERPTIFR